MNEKLYYNATDIAAMLGISMGKSYKILREIEHTTVIVAYADGYAKHRLFIHKMRAKEAAEAEIEILISEKIEAETFIAFVGEQVSECREELVDQKTALDDIKQQISDKQAS